MLFKLWGSEEWMKKGGKENGAQTTVPSVHQCLRGTEHEWTRQRVGMLVAPARSCLRSGCVISPPSIWSLRGEEIHQHRMRGQRESGCRSKCVDVCRLLQGKSQAEGILGWNILSEPMPAFADLLVCRIQTDRCGLLIPHSTWFLSKETCN